MLMLITKPIKKPREEKNQTEIKISKYHQVCLSLSQLKETTCPSLANSNSGRLALARRPSRQQAPASTYIFVHKEQFSHAEVPPTPLCNRKVHMTLLIVPPRSEQAAQQPLCQGTLPSPVTRSPKLPRPLLAFGTQSKCQNSLRGFGE